MFLSLQISGGKFCENGGGTKKCVSFHELSK